MNDLSRKGREPQTAGLFRQENKILTSPLDGGPQSWPGRSCPGSRMLSVLLVSFPYLFIIPSLFITNVKTLEHIYAFPFGSFLSTFRLIFNSPHFLYFSFFLRLLIILGVFLSFLSFSTLFFFFFYWVYTLFFLFPLLVDSSFFSFFKYLWLVLPSWFAQDCEDVGLLVLTGVVGHPIFWLLSLAFHPSLPPSPLCPAFIILVFHPFMFAS